MAIEIEKDTATQIRKLVQDLANFMALYEHSDDKFQMRQAEIQHNIEVFKDEIDKELQHISMQTNELAEIITESGAARLRINVEKAAREGEEHAETIHELIEEFKTVANKTVTRLGHVSKAAEKGIGRIIGAITAEQSQMIDQLQSKAEGCFEKVNTAADDVAVKIKKTVKWLRLERLGIAFFAALFTTLLMGLYVNAEWPWESSYRASYERHLGRSFLSAWPTLSPKEKRDVRTVMGISKDMI